MLSFEQILIFGGLLLTCCVFASKVSSRFGIPSLILFLALGILAGSDGIGGISFSNYALAQQVGIFSLNLILFSGGLSTDIHEVVPIAWSGISLATLGVLITGGLVAVFTHFVFHLTWIEGCLLGATISSTDAAAVFGVLKSRGIRLKNGINELLEFESGCNDPMAVFLTTALIQCLTHSNSSLHPVLSFILEMTVGGVLGIGFGKIAVYLINLIDLESEGLYPVLSLSFVMVIYGATHTLHGNGFLAVYLAGLTMAQKNFIKKRTVMVFHDGLAWLVQITMFLTLGLLVFPKDLGPVALSGVALALFLVLVARPIAVWISLSRSHFSKNEKHMISWVGLRGAVPIILATYPMSANIEIAHFIFNLVFFVVLTSVLLQGSFISPIANYLKLALPVSQETPHHLIEVKIPKQSSLHGKQVVDLGLPKTSLIVSIKRHHETLIPNGGTILEMGDTLTLLTHLQDAKTTEQKITNWTL